MSNEQYKTTFNYLLTHRVIRQMYFDNLDLFYEQIITNPQNMQIFMQNAMQTAADWAGQNPDVEPAYPIEKFDMSMAGDGVEYSVENGIILVNIPNCERMADCVRIAFPCMSEYARYFTCELSCNPLTDEQFFIMGEWTPSGESFKHHNYGQINTENGETFAGKVIKMVYGVDCTPEIEEDDTSDASVDAQESDDGDDYYTKLNNLAGTGWAAFKNGEATTALDYFNQILESEDDNATYFHCRAEITKSLGNNYAADYDMFRAKLIDMNDIKNGITLNWEAEKNLGIGQRLPLIVNERAYDILENQNNELFLCIKAHEGEPRLHEILYSCGKNACLCRRIDQLIVLDEMHEEARTALSKTDKVHVVEVDGKTGSEIQDPVERMNKGKIREYMAAVRQLPSAVSLDSIDEICEDGYPLFAFLSALVRMRVKDGKSIGGLFPKNEYPNLAAVLAHEEDYELLQKYIDEGLPLNEKAGWWFKDWQPAPLFYITSYKVWHNMKDPVKMLKFLADNGADPNLAGGEGDTPLGNQCLGKGTPQVMKALLEAGADPNVKSVLGTTAIAPLLSILTPEDFDEYTHSFTPLTPSRTERAKLLIEAGADVNAANELGETPLGMAITYNAGTSRKELVTLLCEKGADIDAAVNGMKTVLENGAFEYAFALYELYANFPGQEQIPCLKTWLNAQTDLALSAQHYLELSANEGYPPALEVLGKAPAPTGDYFNRMAEKLWHEGKRNESFIQFKEAAKRFAALGITPMLPMPVSNELKEICINKGWQVFQRLSIKGELFPLTLIGDQKVVLLADPSPTSTENVLAAAEEIRAYYQKIRNDEMPETLDVIPVILVFAQYAPEQVKEITLLNAGASCGNNVKGIVNFEDFIEKLGTQQTMPQELTDTIALSVVTVIDSKEQEEQEEQHYMTVEELSAFAANCFKEMDNRQTKLIQKYNLTSYDEFYINQTDEVLQFKKDGKVELEFFFVPIGSWSSEHGSWAWGWANESNTDELRQKSMKIRELAEITGNSLFEDEAVEADEDFARQAAAIAAYHLDAMGVYIAPFGNLKVFEALMRVKE